MTLSTRTAIVSFLSILASFVADASAAPRLAAVFSDNMVLQQGRPLPVWGWAEPGERVTVTMAGRSAAGQAGPDGRWEVRLPALRSRGGPLEMTVSGSSASSLRVKNILVGEVWLCCGPSNIFWPVKRCDNAKQEMAAAGYPEIRFFTVARKTADQPQADCEGRWVECTPQSVADVSAVGYFFARRLHQELKTPVALVQSFWGGSRIEAWTSLDALRAETSLAPILAYWEKQYAEFDAAKAKALYQRELAAWESQADRAKAAGKKAPKKPKAPQDPHSSAHRPACLYNAMIAPLVPYGIRGAITYQGLGNLVWAEHSRALLETMIADWRARWGQGDFPFGMIQPAPYTCEGWASSGADAYSLQRESQIQVLQTVPNTGLALTMDIDAVHTLHFPQKQPVAHRLAAWALATVYGRPGAWRGPMYQSMTIEGDRVRIRFSYAEGGLRTTDGKPPAHFTIAGPDGVFYPAAAVIDGGMVIVRSPQVSRPVAVRFAWGNTDVVNLVNRENLPASLFRAGE
jgi:sialate O-acetylesterase